MKYTLFHPAFDPPTGRAAESIGNFIKNRGEGAGELAAIAEIFSNEELVPHVNYVNILGGPIYRLCQEFLAFLCSFKSVSNSILQTIEKKYGWKELPLSVCGIQSATTGIAATLMANGITSGEVITTSLNFLGVPNAVMLSGCTPKFVDVNPDTLCMDMASLEKAIGKETKAIVLVHFNQFVDLAPVYEILEKNKLDIPVIQDASLALGSTCGGLPAGLVNLGKSGATVYSFATSKILSGLGGAIIVSNNKELIEHIQSIEYQGMNYTDPDDLSTFGANFKMNDLNAAIVLEQLKKRDAIFEKRRKLKSWYDRELADIVDGGKVSIQKIAPEGIVTHYALLLPDRKAAARKMAEKGVALGFWHTMHLQKIYRERFGTRPGTLPVTESLADRITFLPFHTKLTEKDVQFICKSLKECL